jgi:hypothetical protein
VLGKAPIRSRSARPVGALSTPREPADSSTQVHERQRGGDGEIEGKGQADSNDIETAISN